MTDELLFAGPNDPIEPEGPPQALAFPATAFVHPCKVCGGFAYWGYGPPLPERVHGWFCWEHRPCL